MRTGAKIVVAPGMDARAVQQLFSVPEAFVSMCQIVREDESTGYLNPTPAQLLTIRAIEAQRWTFVTKYRQAKITTVTLMHLLLRDCMFLQGISGVLIADTNATAEMAFKRLRFAYENLPSPVKMPLAPGSKGSKKELEFIHGGNIIIKSLEGRAPAVGLSIDRLHITELGEATHQQKAIVSLFPAINKRHNAKLVIESTPGGAGTFHERMWHQALRKEGQFFPLFLEWWTDNTCALPVPAGFIPSEAELEYLGKHRGMKMANVVFLRARLNSEFVGDSRLFSSKYPSDMYDGWIGSQRPMMPEDILRILLESAREDPIEGSYGCGEFANPIAGHKYEVYADPTGFGSVGDPAALTVFDLETLTEVAVWSGREAPDRFAVRIEQVCKRYNDARAVVESNHAGCITSLKDMHVRITYSKRQPGWYATGQRVARAEFDLVRLLREDDLIIRSRSGLQQLLRYDGDFGRRIKGEDGEGHHFDRARTYVMAADMLAKIKRTGDRRDARRPKDEGPIEPMRPGAIPYQMLNRERDSMRRTRQESVFTVPKLR
tara:strand:+ start:522 stop:2162 length:1641 start_codon:yes stop_codon:yes gene_type:complete